MSDTTEPSQHEPAAQRMVRVGLIKAVPVVWDLERNWSTFETLARQGVERGAQLICTPEGFLDGYPVDYDKEHMSAERLRSVSQRLDGKGYVTRAGRFAREHGVHLIFGCSELADDGGSYNAAVLIDDTGTVLGSYHKTHVFGQEAEAYIGGSEIPVWATKLARIGIMICMDRNFVEVARTLTLRGAELIMCPSYGGYGLFNERKLCIRAWENGVPICFAHAVEPFVAGPDAELVAKLRSGLPDVLVCDVPLPASPSVLVTYRRPELYEH